MYRGNTTTLVDRQIQILQRLFGEHTYNSTRCCRKTGPRAAQAAVEKTNAGSAKAAVEQIV
jgi:hypothetical protein